MTETPTTVVLCGPFSSPQRLRRARPARSAAAGPQPPVTWIARLADLRDSAGAGVDIPGSDAVALELEPAWLESRATLRSAIRAARDRIEHLDAAVLADAPLRQHELLAELGIRVVLVDRLPPLGRGVRRPAPAGWPCRNAVWGLWEVRRADPGIRPSLWQQWTHGRGLPAIKTGTLAVLSDGPPMAADAPRLPRWIDATGRRQSRGAVESVRLTDLPDLLERSGAVGGGATAPAGSLLKAA
jgi:hypothetical protein